jgi:hypothetical protein
MYKAARNKPLSIAQRIINRLISSVRYKVERSIGTLKRGYHFSRMRYTGLKKGNMEFLLNATAFNLKKAAAMVECVFPAGLRSPQSVSGLRLSVVYPCGNAARAAS